MDSKSIRQKYLEFFKSKGHQIVSSAPIVNKNDPTLMFTNAGMNQFKDYFLGNKPIVYKRIANSQKCLRVSGKHNDLEEVGIDTYHHTMFEMLGNWSFGDYFKKEAISWSWELLTTVYKLPKEKIYASVFEGDKSEKLEEDTESLELWKQFLPDDRILYGNKKDNFWEMGDQGPCGPCTEIHIDLRSDEDIAKKPGRELVNQGHPLVIEIWNNVFIQYNRMADGRLEPLPAKHVDTGMGFERLSMAIQKKTSNYDTDVFQPMIQFIAKESGIKYGGDEKTDIAMRVLADHIRAIAFTIADGQLPSNNKAGYVVRRILRRAVRYGYTFLNFKTPFLYKLVTVLSEQFEDVFPELKAQLEFIQKVIQEEELSFLRTLDIGLKKLDVIRQEMQGKSNVIDGKVVFELYDTFGFPVDLTALIARENNLQIDEEGFDKEMELQKQRSKQAASVETGDWIIVRNEDRVEFVGFESLQSKSKIIKYRKIKSKNKDEYQIVLDTTPFYAESGGQVGDTGIIQSENEKIIVKDTKKENDLIIHLTDKLPQNVEGEFESIVDKRKRENTASNHSATHLMHAALKNVLGQHVNQKGSFVNDKVLRFDFSHFSKMTPEEIQAVENQVNAKIRENIALVEMRNVPLQEAKKMGATALFGEKYGEFVRIILFDKNYSMELCGGTHVPYTGKIGYCKILAETSVAAGVRRIEAVTGEEAEQYVNENLQLLHEMKERLKNPKDLIKAVDDMMDERSKLNKQIEEFRKKEVAALKSMFLNKIEIVDNVKMIIEQVDISSVEALKQVSFDLKAKVDNLFLVLAANIEGKPMVSVMISDNLVTERDLNANTIVRELAKEIQGGGGGQPFYATAGGKDIKGLHKVIEKARNFVNVVS